MPSLFHPPRAQQSTASCMTFERVPQICSTTVNYPFTAAACPRLATVCCCISGYKLEKSFTQQLHVPSQPQYAVVCISVYTLEKSFALQLLAPIQQQYAVVSMSITTLEKSCLLQLHAPARHSKLLLTSVYPHWRKVLHCSCMPLARDNAVVGISVYTLEKSFALQLHAPSKNHGMSHTGVKCISSCMFR